MACRSLLGILTVLLVGCSGGEETRPNGAASGGAGSGGTGQAAGSAGTGQSGAGASAGGMGSGGEASAGSAGTSAGAGGTSAGGGGGTASGTPMEETLPALLSVRQEHSVVAMGGEIYVIGGYTPEATATVEAYDPVAQGWRDVQELPAALQHANAAAIGTKIYVAGFYPGGGMTTADVRVFEYDADQGWTDGTAMPEGTERAASCVATLGDKIYLFGGARDGQAVADTSAYDTVAKAWEPLEPLPAPREHCVAGAIDGMLYIAGGRNGGIAGVQPETWRYDPELNDYEDMAPIRTPRGGVAGAVLDGRLFIFGGEGSGMGSGVFPDVEAYDPVADAWEVMPAMAVPRHGFGAAALDGRIYLPGGATSQGYGPVDNHSAFFFE